jgi:hypothetical protein
MRRIIAIGAGLAALLLAGLVGADTVKDTVWVKGPYSRDDYTEWRSIESVLECSYGEWRIALTAKGERILTRIKDCKGYETMNLGKLPE